MEDVQQFSVQQSYVDLGEGTKASDYALKNLNAALGKAQIKFSPAVKDLENKYGGYKYVPLENIISSSRVALADNHLTVMQFPATDLERKTVSLITRVSHWDSGEWVQNTLEVPGELALGRDGSPKFNQQTIGGGVTYARKIAYKPILGVSDSDDDIDAGQEQPNMDARANRNTMKATPQQSQQKSQAPDGSRLEYWSKLLRDCVNYADFETYVIDQWGAPDGKGAEAVKEFLLVADKNILSDLFRVLDTVDVFNNVTGKLNQVAISVRKPFIQEVAKEAKERGYVVDRATGAYVEGSKQ